jgi:hypothetical protein
MTSAATSADRTAAELLEQLARCSGHLDKAEERVVGKCCEAGKAVMATRARSMVAESRGMPLLNCKSADGTPVRAKIRLSWKERGATSLRRTGNETLEALVKNQFLRKHSATGVADTCVVLQEPVGLEHGKSVDAIWAVCFRDWRSLRQWGHDGIAIEYYCYDRFGIEAHERRAKQWHHTQSSLHGDIAEQWGTTLEQLSLREWVLVQGCAAHDAQSAFRWGMQGLISDRDLLRDVYISIESLRNSMDLLQHHVMEWAMGRVTFTSPMSASEVEERKELWQALSVDEDTAEVLAEQLQLRFEGGDCWWWSRLGRLVRSSSSSRSHCLQCSDLSAGVSRGG